MGEDGFKKMIRIAVVTYSISHFEVPFYRLLAAAPELDLRVFYLFSPNANKQFDEDYQQGIDWGVNMLEGYPSEHCMDIQQMLQAVLKFGAHAAIIYGYSWPGILPMIWRLRRARVGLIFRGTLNYHIDPRFTRMQRLRRPFRGLVFHLFDTHQYGGSYSEQVLASAGIPRHRRFFVPYAVDNDHFLTSASDARSMQESAELKADLDWQDAFPKILFIGQLSWVKGPDIALDVFERFIASHPNARMAVVGNGALMDSLKQRTKGTIIENKVHFAGYCPSMQTIKWYLSADIVLFTSRYETWARSINEAMLCGKPVIINPVIPAAGGLVEHGRNGFVTASLMVEDYVDRLNDFCELSTEERQQLGSAARHTAMNYSYSKYLDNAVTSIRCAVERRK